MFPNMYHKDEAWENIHVVILNLECENHVNLMIKNIIKTSEGCGAFP